MGDAVGVEGQDKREAARGFRLRQFELEVARGLQLCLVVTLLVLLLSTARALMLLALLMAVAGVHDVPFVEVTR